MARVRTRVQRSFYLLLALLVLLLLLQLNQWLPGVWKGGGEGGFRAAGDLGLRRPDAASQDPQPAPDADDASAIEPPTAPPRDWPPKRGLRVRVVGPDGSGRGGWRLGTGDRGALKTAPDEGGQGLVRDDRLFVEGFRVHLDGTELRHRQGLDLAATAYVVHLPPAELPRPRQPGPVQLTVVDPATGAPVEGAEVSWSEGESRATARTDAEGAVEVPTGDGAPRPVQIAKAGHVVRTEVIRPRATGAQRVDLPAMFRRDLVARWADGRAATVTDWKVHAADGRLLAGREAGGTPMGAQIPLSIPADEREGAHLALRVSGSEVEGFVVSVPLAEVEREIVLPHPRTLRVVARDVRGEPVPDAEVLVTREGGEAETSAPLGAYRTRTNLRGEARVSLAPGQTVRVIVQKGELGPAARRLSAVDGTDTLEFVLEPGVMIPVRVEGVAPTVGFYGFEGGASAGGVRIDQRRTLRREPGAPVRFGPFPPGPVELYVGARGHGWTARVVEARPAMGAVEVALEKAWALRLVIADPHGVPVPGAEVSLATTDEGEPLVVPPSARSLRSDAQGLVTVDPERSLAGHALPDRIYEARIRAPGYESQVIPNLRPGGTLHFVTLMPQP